MIDITLKDEIYNKPKRFRKTGFKIISKAKRYIDDLKHDFYNQEITLNKGMLFSEAYNQYIKDCELKVKKGKLEESTLKSKKTVFKNQILAFFKTAKISTINDTSIKKWHSDLLLMENKRVKGKPLGVGTLQKAHKQLSAFLNWCKKMKLIKEKPAGDEGNFESIKKEKDFLTIDEVETLLSVIPDIRDRFIIELLFYTGLRIGELLALTTDDIITTDKGTLIDINQICYDNKMKDGAMDDLFLDEYTLETYNTYLVYRKNNKITSKYLFYNGIGKYEVIGDKAVRDMIKKYTKLAGIDKHVTPHSFRHSQAALLMSQGYQLEDIKTRLRHTNIRTTSNEYGHLYKDRKIMVAKDISNLRAKIVENRIINDAFCDA